MKRLLFIGCVIGCILMLAVSIAIYKHNNNSDQLLPTSTAEEITMEMVARHNNPESCWVVIGTKVYSVSRLFEQDTSTAAILQASCGSSFTSQLDTQQQVKLRDKLEPYYIGIIVP